MKQILRTLFPSLIILGIITVMVHPQRSKSVKPKAPASGTNEPSESRDIWMRITVTGSSVVLTIQPHHQEDAEYIKDGTREELTYGDTVTFVFADVPLKGNFGPINETSVGTAVWSGTLITYFPDGTESRAG